MAFRAWPSHRLLKLCRDSLGGNPFTRPARVIVGNKPVIGTRYDRCVDVLQSEDADQLQAADFPERLKAFGTGTRKREEYRGEVRVGL